MSAGVPTEIRELAEARVAARAAGDWAEADRLRTTIEAAGWRIVDSGTRFRLSPAVAADVVDDERVRYGASSSVPSRLASPASEGATVVVRATDRPHDVDRLLAGLRRYAPPGTQVVVVADAPSDEQAQALVHATGPVVGADGGVELEIVWTATRLGEAGARNAGIRRSSRSIVILVDSAIEPTGDFLRPMVDALAEPTVAIVGAWGSRSADLRRFDPAPPGDVAVIDPGVVAFRRGDVSDRGPLDEIFRTGRHLDAWWSLVLRDQGEGSEPRRAVRLADLPVIRHEEPDDGSAAPGQSARLDKRAFYRIVDRFGRRIDLVVVEPGA